MATKWGVIGLVVFLAGETGRYITGTAFDVTAGLSADWSA